MCMSCNSKEQHSHMNKRRLSLLLGVVGVIVAAAVGAVLLSPALAAFIPLLALLAACPAMYTANRLVSWVKGGAKRDTVTRIEQRA